VASISELMPDFMIHTLMVEPYQGISGEGEALYGASFSLTGFCDEKVRTIRASMTQNSTGAAQLSAATFFTDRGPAVPTNSRVTLPSGRTSRVLAVLDRDGGLLPTPSHLEIVIE
jgi:hypothetical protein